MEQVDSSHPNAATSAIYRIAADLSALEGAWERSPLVSAGLGEFGDVFSLAIADRLVHSGLPLSAIRMSRNGTKLPSERVVAMGPTRDIAPRVCGDLLAKEIYNGAHVILEMVDFYCPEVARFVATLGRDLGYSVLSAAFITPAGSRGVVHYDTSSVFLRQVYGSKRWRVFAPKERWPIEDWRSTMQVDTEQVLEVVLKVGECLYIPRGFIHVGDATSEGSVHLSLAIRPPTWGDILRLAVDNCANSEVLREAIPPNFMHADETRLFREKLAALHMPVIASLRPSRAHNAARETLDLVLQHQSEFYRIDAGNPVPASTEELPGPVGSCA